MPIPPLESESAPSCHHTKPHEDAVGRVPLECKATEPYSVVRRREAWPKWCQLVAQATTQALIPHNYPVLA
ncbi:predicted protein [Histoplasma mississippiense (nom. inval.)]|uniref:predicted protein n=1 Tax=Ajellomyces capsulatus (strain NAm1 / WU24) TaxID=2059318 RepID=UPI000157C323|nr:predicted protein [Histoplasma mississippiense (nom. inval.)]EDN07897.1 predicted protein [Histoplasma mississippiense (nom. inval.)]